MTKDEFSEIKRITRSIYNQSNIEVFNDCLSFVLLRYTEYVNRKNKLQGGILYSYVKCRVYDFIQAHNIYERKVEGIQEALNALPLDHPEILNNSRLDVTKALGSLNADESTYISEYFMDEKVEKSFTRAKRVKLKRNSFRKLREALETK